MEVQASHDFIEARLQGLSKVLICVLCMLTLGGIDQPTLDPCSGLFLQAQSRLRSAIPLSLLVNTCQAFQSMMLVMWTGGTWQRGSHRICSFRVSGAGVDRPTLATALGAFNPRLEATRAAMGAQNRWNPPTRGAMPLSSVSRSFEIAPILDQSPE